MMVKIKFVQDYGIYAKNCVREVTENSANIFINKGYAVLFDETKCIEAPPKNKAMTSKNVTTKSLKGNI